MYSFKKFSDQYEQSLTKCNLTPFENLEEWFLACVRSKGFLINNLGQGLKGTYELEVDDEVENEDCVIPKIQAGSSTSVEFPSDLLNKYAVNFIKTESKYKIHDFRSSKLPDGRRSMKVMRKIAEKAMKKSPDAGYTREIQNFYRRLDRFYNQSTDKIRFPHNNYEVTISCDPIDFLKLGHRHCDAGSCFGAGPRGLARYKIATARNSFVMLVREAGEETEDRYLGRCWGFYNYTNKTWHLTNFYTKEISKESFMFLIKVIMDDICGKTHTDISNRPIEINAPGIYNNNDGFVVGCKETISSKVSIQSEMKFSEELSLVDPNGNMDTDIPGIL